MIETSRTDDFFYNSFKSSSKSKHRSLSLPPVRGNFILINRMMNCSPLNKFRFRKIGFTYPLFLLPVNVMARFKPVNL
jgi:hypothetical protein